jgi:hypothetical protein
MPESQRSKKENKNSIASQKLNLFQPHKPTQNHFTGTSKRTTKTLKARQTVQQETEPLGITRACCKRG